MNFNCIFNFKQVCDFFGFRVSCRCEESYQYLKTSEVSSQSKHARFKTKYHTNSMLSLFVASFVFRSWRTHKDKRMAVLEFSKNSGY